MPNCAQTNSTHPRTHVACSWFGSNGLSLAPWGCALHTLQASKHQLTLDLIKLNPGAGFSLNTLNRFTAATNNPADGKLWNFDLNACTTALCLIIRTHANAYELLSLSKSHP